LPGVGSSLSALAAPASYRRGSRPVRQAPASASRSGRPCASGNGLAPLSAHRQTARRTPGHIHRRGRDVAWRVAVHWARNGEQAAPWSRSFEWAQTFNASARARASPGSSTLRLAFGLPDVTPRRFFFVPLGQGVRALVRTCRRGVQRGVFFGVVDIFAVVLVNPLRSCSEGRHVQCRCTVACAAGRGTVDR